MDIKCPHCGTEYEVEQKDMYRHTQCEVCGKGFVIGATTGQARNAESAATNASGEGSSSDKVKEAVKAVADATVQKVRNVYWKQQGERAKSIAKKVAAATSDAMKRQQGVEHKHGGQCICTRCGSVSERPWSGNNIGCLTVPIAMLAVGWFIGGILRFIDNAGARYGEFFDERVQAYFMLSFLAMICVGIVTLVAIKVYGRCPLCKNTNCRVDLESPMGKKLFKELHSENGAG